MSKEIQTKGNYLVVNRDGSRVASFAMEEDMNLFTAVPELLRALETAYDALYWLRSFAHIASSDDPKVVAVREDTIAEVKQAIAKAKGQVSV